MKIKMTETEMKNLANANTQYFMDDYGNFQKATQEEHKIFYNLFYGALLGMNWHCHTIDANDKIQAIIDTAEFQFNLFFPNYAGYTNIYKPLQSIWAVWSEE